MEWLTDDGYDMTFGVNVVGTSLQSLRRGCLMSSRTLPLHAVTPPGSAGREKHVAGPPLAHHLAVLLRVVPVDRSLGLVQRYAAAEEGRVRYDVCSEQVGA